MNASFALPTEPAWVTCPDCAKLVAPGACPVCADNKARAVARRDRDRALGFVERFDWVDPYHVNLGAPDGVERVSPLTWMRGTLAETVTRVLGDARSTVTFYGPAGRGKTTLAVACAKTFATASFASAIDLEREMMSRTAFAEPDAVRRARECRVLVLDDVGKENGTKLSPIPAIIQARHDHELKTFVTTGLRPDQVLARYDEGIHRRLFEAASALVIGWKS